MKGVVYAEYMGSVEAQLNYTPKEPCATDQDVDRFLQEVSKDNPSRLFWRVMTWPISRLLNLFSLK